MSIQVDIWPASSRGMMFPKSIRGVAHLQELPHRETLKYPGTCPLWHLFLFPCFLITLSQKTDPTPNTTNQFLWDVWQPVPRNSGTVIGIGDEEAVRVNWKDVTSLFSTSALWLLFSLRKETNGACFQASEYRVEVIASANMWSWFIWLK